MRKIALVTGATAGIGEATAILLAGNEFDLILTGRRIDRLEKIKAEIEEKYSCNVLLLHFDVRNLDATKSALENLPEKWKNIDVLINNAGLAVGLNPLQEGVVDDWERMIDTNIKGLLYVSRIIAPLMITRSKGHIVNVSSIAGKETYPNGNVYCATKHAVQSITQGMRLDMVEHGIKVSSICPGAVDTEFSLVRFKGNQKQAGEVYEGFTPLYAADVAEAILFMVTRPPHVNIDDLLIMPKNQAFSRIIHKSDTN
jgi:NADP-dependent 3-hydroxy acid dehydrogenase YdfG